MGILCPIAILERFYFVSLKQNNMKNGYIFSLTVGNFRFRVMNVLRF